MSTSARLAAAVIAAAAVLTACGGDVEEDAAPTTAGAPVDQTVEVRMLDTKFEPDAITVRAGTTVRFVFTNDGKLVHEAAFGGEATQEAVAEGKARREGPRLGPNQTGDHVRTFTSPGTLLVGCHIPGHYQAGMRIRLTVQ